MKSIVLFTLSLFFVSAFNAQPVNKKDLSDIKYLTEKKDTIKIIAKLNKRATINGMPCEKDWIHFDKSFIPLTFKLSEKKSINNFEYPIGTWIYMKPDGIVCVFPSEFTVQGYKCRGGGGISGVQTAFYKSGKLKMFFSSTEIEVDGVKCSGGSKKYIELYENGKLKKCN